MYTNSETALVLVLYKELHLFQAHAVAPERGRGVVGADAGSHLLVVVGQHQHNRFERGYFIKKYIFQQLRHHGLVAAEQLIELLVELGPERIEVGVEGAGVFFGAFSFAGFRVPTGWVLTALGRYFHALAANDDMEENRSKPGFLVELGDQIIQNSERITHVT